MLPFWASQRASANSSVINKKFALSFRETKNVLLIFITKKSSAELIFANSNE